MSAQISYCCCGGEGGCFFGANATSGIACVHDNKEELLFKRERPAFMNERQIYNFSETSTGATCDCAGEYVLGYGCEASSSVVVKYEHFQNNDPGRVYGWYYATTGLFPSCDDGCCGYTDDDDCCGGSYPTGCNSAHWTISGLLASKYQARAIDNGTMPHLSGNVVAEDCELGDQYSWLRGVSDRSGSEYYEHWGVSGGVVSQLSNRRLVETIICVVHKEKWWKSYENSLTLSDAEGGSSSDRSAADCAVFPYAVFGCSGVFLCSWEVKGSGLDAAFGPLTSDAFLVKISEGDPIPEAWMDLLEEEGILGPVQDWEQAGGEIIKKTLTYYDSRGAGPSTDTFYGYGRTAGWTYVCNDWAVSMDWDAWPQIPRQYSVGCDFGGLNNCHTAAPIPGNDCEDCVVDVLNGSTPPSGCLPCAVPYEMGDCVPPVIAVCGNLTPGICDGDVIVGTCRGLWVQYWQYSLTKTTPTLTLNYKCTELTNGYLCRVGYPPATCEWDELPDSISHMIPEEVSASVRNGTSLAINLCCEGMGQVDTITPASGICPANTPSGAECDEPPDWGPGI